MRFLRSAKGAVPSRQTTEGTRDRAAARTRPVLRVFLKSSCILILLSLNVAAADAPTPLSALLDEATRNNPDILAARRGWQAATQVPTQVSTLPDPQVTVQS